MFPNHGSINDEEPTAKSNPRSLFY